MHIKRIHEMIECLTDKTKTEMGKGLENIDTCELSNAIEMIEKLNEAEYYALVAKAMQEDKEHDKESMGYEDFAMRPMRPMRTRRANYSKNPIDYNPILEPARLSSDMYYSTPYYGHANYSNSPDYTEGYQAGVRDSQRDYREGESGGKRMSFMISKEIHNSASADDKQTNMKALEKYLDSLQTDILAMVNDMDANEIAMLKNRLTTWIGKIA